MFELQFAKDFYQPSETFLSLLEKVDMCCPCCESASFDPPITRLAHLTKRIDDPSNIFDIHNDNEYPQKMVFSVRKDLDPTIAQVAVACCDATLGLYKRAITEYPDWIKLWQKEGQAKNMYKT